MREGMTKTTYGLGQTDVLEFVAFINGVVDDPLLGIPLVNLMGNECHVRYSHKQQCFYRYSAYCSRMCMTTSKMRVAKSVEVKMMIVIILSQVVSEQKPKLSPLVFQTVHNIIIQMST